MEENGIDGFPAGNSPWCKDLTKETDERIANYAIKISNSLAGKSKSEDHIKHNSEAHKGKVPWNKGLIVGPLSEEQKRNMGPPKGNQNAKGITWTDERKNEHSKRMTRNHYSAGRKDTEEQRQVKSERVSGESNPCYGKTGENHPAFGKHRTEESKAEMRKPKRKVACKYCEKLIGCNKIKIHESVCKMR